MNRINNAFRNGKAFIAFLTGGDPDIETTEALIPVMGGCRSRYYRNRNSLFRSHRGRAGDPGGERPARLAAGCTVDRLFDMVARVRKTVKIPLLFMTYANPIYAYGTQRFMERCQTCGDRRYHCPGCPL